MVYLGVHDGHNASACLVRDGRIEFAIQEERLTGVKNEFGYPGRAVAACLEHGRITPNDVAAVAFATLRHTPSRHRSVDQRAAFARERTARGLFRRLCLWYPYYRLASDLGWRERLANAERSGFRPEQAVRFEHHLCHAATAYYGMRRDPGRPYLVVTCDGHGDLTSAGVWRVEAGRFERLGHTPFDHSLGAIYGQITGALGFTPLEHEYKLMGMAPYAARRHAEAILARLRRVLVLDGAELRFRRGTLLPTMALSRRMMGLIRGERIDNVCAALQEFTEEMLVGLVRAAVERSGVSHVLCAGGVFMNVKANKRIMELDGVDWLGVFPSCGDETLSMGACWLAQAEASGDGGAAIEPLGPFYLGGDVTDEACRAALAGSPHRVERLDDPEAEVARLLAAGKIVARCRGRMEFGARALCNRSILADPRDHDVVRVINRMVKKRDFWMPFAPAVRRERLDEYFVNPKALSSPYMMLTFDSRRENFRDLIAAVHNADLTARPQVVERDHNPDVYRLLQLFESLTGRGVVLNTSFNLHGFPIVAGPREALHVFDNSGLEHLNVGNWLVSKR
jgi:carbamoyltransferase